jgi:hypothetical protein
MSAPRERSQRYSPKTPTTMMSDTKAMRQSRKPERMGAFGARGGRFMTSPSLGSKASASARVTAVIMLTQRICTGVMGRARPSRMAAMRVSVSPPLVGRMKSRAFRRLS